MKRNEIIKYYLDFHVETGLKKGKRRNKKINSLMTQRICERHKTVIKQSKTS